MRHLINSIFVMAFLTFSLPSNGQENDRKILTDNEVHKASTYHREIKKNGKFKKFRHLIEKTIYDNVGNVRINYFYENGNLTSETHFSYYDDNQIKDIMEIQNQDTTYQEYEPSEYPEIITGGIPGCFPKVGYYSNGLLKYTTVRMMNSGKVLFEYEYEFRKN